MLRSGSKGMSFTSPDIKDLHNFSFKDSNGNAGVGRSRKSISGLSPMRYLQRLGAKVARAISLVSVKRRRRKRKSSSKVSSTNSTRSRPSMAPLESHQAEAIQDCIQFINSSSLQRSYSVSAA